MNITILIAPDENLEYLKGWRSCTDPKSSKWPGHAQAMKEQGWCPCCGEFTGSLIISDRERITLFVKDNQLLRIDKGGITYILNYPKIRELYP